MPDVYIDGIKVIRDARELANALQNETEIAFDTETTGLSPWYDSIATMQFYGKNTNALGVIQLPNHVVPEEIKALWTPDRTFVGHNMVGFDIQLLHTHGVKWDRAKWYDTLVGETVVVSTGRRDVSKSLRASARRRLDMTIDKDIEHGHWDEELTDKQIHYAAQDVISLHALRNAQIERAEETQQTEALAMETELMPIMAKMTCNGLPAKRELMEQHLLSMYDKQDSLTYDLFQMLGEINLESHTQIKKAVRERYGKVWKSTAKDALIDLTYDGTDDDIFIAKKLLEYREPATFIKMHGPDWMNQYLIEDWIHPRFWQCSANTGRTTCSDPNIQQWDRDARFLVGNLPGHKIIKCDLSQIEVRVAAYLAKDEELITALANEDIHSSIASLLFDMPLANVSSELRRMAKAAVFALLYCGGPTLLYNKARLDGFPMTFERAQQIFTAFFTRFKGLYAMRNRAIAMSKNNRMVSIRMPNGLRRILVGGDLRPTIILNNSVQGFAAVVLKQGVINAANAGLLPYLGAVVHDETVACAPDNVAKEVAITLKESMLTGAKKYLPIPVDAEVQVANTWAGEKYDKASKV